MKLVSKNASTSWKAVILAVTCVLMLVPLTACDEDVRDLLVDGLNQAANVTAITLIDAAFQSITPDCGSTSPCN